MLFQCKYFLLPPFKATDIVGVPYIFISVPGKEGVNITVLTRITSVSRYVFSYFYRENRLYLLVSSQITAFEILIFSK
jgi:hypothetical protein